MIQYLRNLVGSGAAHFANDNLFDEAQPRAQLPAEFSGGAQIGELFISRDGRQYAFFNGRDEPGVCAVPGNGRIRGESCEVIIDHHEDGSFTLSALQRLGSAMQRLNAGGEMFVAAGPIIIKSSGDGLWERAG